jgi:hypothetical protein
MNSCSKTFLLTLTVVMVLLLCAPAFAQGPSDLTVADQTAGAPAAPQAPQNAATTDDDQWHVAVTPYLWFPGMSGTVGALGHTTSVHASATDVLSHFNIGIMGAVEARKNRLVVPIDFMWIKLSDDKGIPLNDIGATSVKAKVYETIFTPKVGYRFVDQEKFKGDVLVGFRYWYLGQNLSLQPVGIGNGISASQSWADVVAGAKFEMVLSPKVGITVLGDAGGGGAHSDYQVAGLLGYKIKPTVILQGGWRYMSVDFQSARQFIFDTHMSGLLLGVTFNVK